MFIIKHRKLFIAISALLVCVSIFIIGLQKLQYGIEFTGGSVLEVAYEDRPAFESMRSSLDEQGYETALLQPFGDRAYVVKTQALSETERKNLVAVMNVSDSGMSIERFNSIGPSVGKQLRIKSLYALILVSLAIVLFIAYAFRHVSKPVSSWKYGVVAVAALLHDIIIPIGILTLLAGEVDTLYVVGLLSILGLSVNDTIVVFDRIRENLAFNKEKKVVEDFTITVGNAISQTITRSIFTSLTLMVVLLALYFYGPVATQTLSLVLLLGTVVGTYSSIFLASPLLTILAGKKK